MCISNFCGGIKEITIPSYPFHRAAWLVLSGASAGGFALSFVSLQWFLHAGDYWCTPVLADLPGAIQCL